MYMIEKCKVVVDSTLNVYILISLFSLSTKPSILYTILREWGS